MTSPYPDNIGRGLSGMVQNPANSKFTAKLGYKAMFKQGNEEEA
jgi:hypothetical protein